jgi:hypothetical protein
MTTRTVKVLGWGTGVSPAKITATLDGNTVFDGQVNLVELAADNESEQTAPTLFTFEIPMNYAGTMHMTVSVANAPVRFGQIVANYTEVGMGGITYSSGADNYMDVADYDSDYVRDPRTNVTINNIVQSADRKLGKGAWHWIVSPGLTLAHDLIVPKPGMADD